ncbi:MAG: FAD-dependent monooxygenase [candidate division NC10 bacterium]|nr:FAD-dependent monooxygenase [candidate division NC10 bacterium]
MGGLLILRLTVEFMELVPERDFDVLVVGGGPAGSVLTTRLAHLGYRVCLLDRKVEISIGETLSPSVRMLFSHAGVEVDWCSPMAIPTGGNLVCWGNPEIEHIPFSPDGRVHGYQVDRSAFDAALRQKASFAGAVVFSSADLLDFCKLPGDAWQCTFSALADRPRTIRARWIADATGRRHRLGGKLTTYRTYTPHLFGIIGYWTSPGTSDHQDLLVEALEEGWLSFAPLPTGQANIALMTGLEVVRSRATQSLREFYLQNISSSRYTWNKVSSFKPPQRVRIFDATPRIADASIGPGWILVGDASSELDPLCGQGVQKAVSSALTASLVIHTILARPSHAEVAIQFYEGRERSVFAEHLRGLYHHYARETRWSDRAFWKARMVPSEWPFKDELLPYRSGSVHLQPHDRIRLGRGTCIVKRPVLEGEFIEIKEVVTSPGNERGVRYYGTICVPDLLALLEDSPRAVDVVQRYLAKTARSMTPQYLFEALCRLLSSGIIEKL